MSRYTPLSGTAQRAAGAGRAPAAAPAGRRPARGAASRGATGPIACLLRWAEEDNLLKYVVWFWTAMGNWLEYALWVQSVVTSRIFLRFAIFKRLRRLEQQLPVRED